MLDAFDRRRSISVAHGRRMAAWTQVSAGTSSFDPDWYAEGAITSVEKFEMAYIVQADDSGDDAISISVADRKQALAAAVELESEGRSGVKIIGDGRIYTTKELARAIIDKE